MEDIIVEPPLYFAEEHVFDVCFHPSKDILVGSLITGQVEVQQNFLQLSSLQYSEDDVQRVLTLRHHKESCRQSVFSPTGNSKNFHIKQKLIVLATISKDKSYGLIDVNGQLQFQKHNAHNNAINYAQFLTDDVLSTGDDDGNIKIWDLRAPEQAIFDVKEQEEAITGIVFAKSVNYMLSASQDGTLAVFDLRKSNNSQKKLLALSDCMEEDLTSICMVKNDQFVACSTSLGVILLFKWDWFGDCRDRITGHPNSIESMVVYYNNIQKLKIDENTLITGNEDGFVRGVSVYPNQITDILGQHEEDEHFPIQKIALSHCQNFIASCSHDNSVKFYDISGFVNRRKQTVCQDQFDDEEEEEHSEIKILSKKQKKDMLDEEEEEEDEEESDDEQEGEKIGEESQEDEEEMSNDSSDDDDSKEEHKVKSQKRKYNPNLKSINKENEKQKRMNFFKDL